MEAVKRDETIERHLPFGTNDAADSAGQKSWDVLGHTYWPLLGGDQASSFAWTSYDPAGTFVPPHSHPDQDEHVYILEGEYSLYKDGEWMTAKAGDSVRWPRGSLHAYRIDADQPGRALFWVSPAGELSTLFDELSDLKDPAEVVRRSAIRDIFFAAPGDAPGWEAPDGQ